MATRERGFKRLELIVLCVRLSKRDDDAKGKRITSDAREMLLE